MSDAPAERIRAATIERVYALGYGTVTVEDIIRTAAVSRRTFYELHSSKEDSFLAAFEHRLADWQLGLPDSGTTRPGRRATARTVLSELFDKVRADPVAAHLLFVEAWAAGTAGRRRAADELEKLAAAIQISLREADSPPEVSEVIALCLAAGLVELVANRCAERRFGELVALTDQLASWLNCYRSVRSAVVIDRACRELVTPLPIVGGPAVPPGGLPAELDDTVSMRRCSPVERIMTAIPSAAAAKDDTDLSANEILRRAHVSPHTFREHFGSAQEALTATALRGIQSARAHYLPFMLAAAGWETSVLAGLVALAQYFDARPALGRFSHYFLVSQSGRKLRTMQIDSWSGTLLPGFRRTDRHRIVAEAIGGGIFRAMLWCYTRGELDRVGTLGPAFAYLALAPFVGAGDASAMTERFLL